MMPGSFHILGLVISRILADNSKYFTGGWKSFKASFAIEYHGSRDRKRQDRTFVARNRVIREVRAAHSLSLHIYVGICRVARLEAALTSIIALCTCAGVACQHRHFHGTNYNCV